jgi:hypothetical protein
MTGLASGPIVDERPSRPTLCFLPRQEFFRQFLDGQIPVVAIFSLSQSAATLPAGVQVHNSESFVPIDSLYGVRKVKAYV